MVIISGTAGSGKSTTQACIIDAINRTREAHIITLEDPIEYLHADKQSIISQREIAIDTKNYLTGLRACLRQAPDVILLGEMRDAETIRTAMTAAETGHLVIATLHTKGAVNTIDRIVDSFPADQQDQIKIQLSLVLDSIVSQQLLHKGEGGMIPAFEVMKNTPAIRNLIRDSKNRQYHPDLRQPGNDIHGSVHTEPVSKRTNIRGDGFAGSGKSRTDGQKNRYKIICIKQIMQNKNFRSGFLSRLEVFYGSYTTPNSYLKVRVCITSTCVWKIIYFSAFRQWLWLHLYRRPSRG